MSEYNGWANYETWCVNLWVDNDPGTYGRAVEMARESEGDRHALADQIEGWVEEWAREGVEGLTADLVGAALSEVRWSEIAEHWIADHCEEGDDE
jgi:hypothetical protein